MPVPRADSHPLPVESDTTRSRVALGRAIFAVATIAMALLVVALTLDTLGVTHLGFSDWRPVLYGYVAWAAAFCVSQVLVRGEDGQRALFVLPAVLFTVAMAIFPTFFGLGVAFTDWNLSSAAGPTFNGFANLTELLSDLYFWNALLNMLYYVLAVLVQYAIAFGLALLLNADIRARKFFRVAFLLPLMLSPVAVSWMIGKSLLEYRFGPAAALARSLGWAEPAFFASPWLARLSIMAMDAWVSIPFLMILLLAGLQALPEEIKEAAKVDGATGWQSFKEITFPLMLPVSITAIVLRIIFELKLADIVINVTAGGPGGATDTMSSFIFREYRDRSNVGYGTMLAEVYLVIIVVFITLVLGRRIAADAAGRTMRRTQ